MISEQFGQLDAECETLTKQFIQTCLYETNFIGPIVPAGQPQPIYNFQQIINDRTNCAIHPLTTSNGCVEFFPGFCGAMLRGQSNTQWDIYRSSGVTEITVGDTNKPPGANFATVRDAIGQALDTNCRFIRITDNVTETAGPLNLPTDTLIYIDSGATWNTTNTPLVVAAGGTLIITGSNNLLSSTMIYGGSGTHIVNAAALFVHNVHLIHNNGAANELFASSSTAMTFDNVTVDCDAFGTFLSSAGSSFASLRLQDCTLRGTSAFASDAISTLGSIASLDDVVVRNLTLAGTWSAASSAIEMQPGSGAVWSSIRVETTSTVGITFGGDNVTQLIDTNRRSALTVGAATVLHNAEFNSLVFAGNNLVLSDLRGNTMDMGTSQVFFPTLNPASASVIISPYLPPCIQPPPSVPPCAVAFATPYQNIQLNNVVVGSLATITFPNTALTGITTYQLFALGPNTVINNFKCMSTAFPFLTPSVQWTYFSFPFNPPPQQTFRVFGGGRAYLNGVELGTTWRVYNSSTALPNSSAPDNGGLFVANSTIHGTVQYGFAMITQANPQGSNINGIGQNGLAIFKNVQVDTDLLVGNIANRTLRFFCNNVNVGRDFTINIANGDCFADNFRVGRDFTETSSAMTKCSNGFIGRNASMAAGTDCLVSHYINMEILGNLVCGFFTNGVPVGRNAQLENFTCMYNGSTVTIQGGDCYLKNFNTRKDPVTGAARSGLILCNSNTNGNVLENWVVHGGSFRANGNNNVLNNFKMTGAMNTADAPGFVQSFEIEQLTNTRGYGSQTRLHNVQLGSWDITNTDTMTLHGFGSTVDGAYSVVLGNLLTVPEPIPSAGVQIDGFSLYPKRGQTIVAGVGDITGALSATQNVSINANYSTYQNMRLWSYPGGATSIPSAIILIGHSLPAQTITINANDSLFSNLIVGYGDETPTTPAGDVGIVNVLGNRNTFTALQTLTLNAATAVDTQFIGCKIRPTGGGSVNPLLSTQCSGNTNFSVLVGLGGTNNVANT